MDGFVTDYISAFTAEAIGRADAIALIDEVFGHMFPGLHAS